MLAQEVGEQNQRSPYYNAKLSSLLLRPEGTLSIHRSLHHSQEYYFCNNQAEEATCTVQIK